MTDRSITPLRRTGSSRYSDTAALNDIHALLTSTDPGDGALTDIALILGRAGRPLMPVRDIEISATETALGRPVACVEAGDASVRVRQATDGTGLLIEICTKTADRARRADRHPRRRPAPRAPPRGLRSRVNTRDAAHAIPAAAPSTPIFQAHPTSKENRHDRARVRHPRHHV